MGWLEDREEGAGAERSWRAQSTPSKVAAPSSGQYAERQRAWNHSRETPPASMPSSPWKVTDSLSRISAALRMRSWWKESSNTWSRRTVSRSEPW